MLKKHHFMRICLLQGNPLDYTCICAPGYTGINCSENIDECISEPCMSNGQCRVKVVTNQTDYFQFCSSLIIIVCFSCCRIKLMGFSATVMKVSRESVVKLT